jgi:vacuolar-type H+-ATPase subunit I/STV1
VEFLLRLLENFRQEVEQTGSLSDHSKKAIAKYFSYGEGRLASCCSTLRPVRADGANIHPAPEEPTEAPADQQALRKVLGEEKKRLEAALAVERDQEDRRLDSKEARSSIPEALDKFLRYESALERQLYRALHHFERIQRRRKGEMVPPPVSVDFSCER